ncbi:hypothetical protein ALMP_43450 [Streptomyces sp. A012304]|nr:hypothetical protein ALMP_43450 [Streptomyces sp. A012304]
MHHLSQRTGRYGTRLGSVAVRTVLQAAFGTYPLSSVLARLPREIIETARTDGANKWQVLWRIVVVFLPVFQRTLTPASPWVPSRKDTPT